MTYTLVWDDPAHRQLRNLDPTTRKRVIKKTVSLESNPRPHGAKKLSGLPDTWRIRAGDYRILYTIEDDRLIVLVIKIGHRREVYR
ncbi:MAG: plasmid stabilization protein [Magnetococcales bacterium]|nr:plasmid stabilization protein [Magnetococcales bacterium]HIJ84713.1 type II toxin-antitoxin system RelE/ParE family toxin [Magnetococcales bacterium]